MFAFEGAMQGLRVLSGKPMARWECGHQHGEGLRGTLPPRPSHAERGRIRDKEKRACELCISFP
ncbi:hypothetical protein BV20DRAFT_973745 [Pilatotrama ljubarskyi]|nr:hypothetical protein BV20DRAFT_973745 [Pilatotrama ljubarskyi]